jgi:single-strand DNA-binding protein
MSVETTTVAGNLTADPELRFTTAGGPVARFTVASTSRVQDNSSGEWRDGDTLFLRCTVWRRTAENVVESLRKGNRVVVTGRLQQRTYETDDGQRRSTIELVADEVSVSLRHAIVRAAPSRAHTDAGQAVQPAPLERRAATPVTEIGGKA